MGKGNLLINTFADNVGQPVSGARISFTNVQIPAVVTNADGQALIEGLDCPDAAASLVPESEVLPYGLYSIVVEKEGLITTVINDIEIFDGITSIQNVILLSDSESGLLLTDIELPQHTLVGDYAPKIKQNPDELIQPPTSTFVLPRVVIPEFVIVHDGLPTNSAAPNYNVPFTEYIKNVASSEIYATWPVETIKANVFAILSFTLNRIYTEWYVAKGYPFTITSSTQYDQKFIYGRTIFDSISRVVDSIFYYYITRGNNNVPFFSQYNDGIKVNNPGWLSQWGSKYLGDQGYTAINILKYYYGNDVSLAAAQKVSGIPYSFPGYVLKVGICGEAVQKVQNELNVITSSYPGIPKIYPANGKYEANTKNTVQVFQRVFNLPITGEIDITTWYKISSIYVGVNNMLKSRYAFITPRSETFPVGEQ